MRGKGRGGNSIKYGVKYRNMIYVRWGKKRTSKMGNVNGYQLGLNTYMLVPTQDAHYIL